MTDSLSNEPNNASRRSSRRASDFSEPYRNSMDERHSWGECESAIEHVFRTSYSELVRFCKFRIKSEFEAEDIVQNAFVAIQSSYADKRSEELRRLLFTTVRNLSVNWHKSGHTRCHRASEDVADVADRLANDWAFTPERELMDMQSLQRAQQALEALPERKRAVVVLHRFGGLTYRQIADQLEVSETTVKTDLAQALLVVSEWIAKA